MAKKNQQQKAKQAARRKQQQNQSYDAPVEHEVYKPKGSKEPQRMSGSQLAKLIIVVLLVLGLVGSMSCGIIASAYGLSSEDVSQVTQLDSSANASHLRGTGATTHVFEGDLIDGNPLENYTGVTDDLPYVEAPIAGICTSDGRMLFERNADAQVTMASTTKMMTAIVALETLPLDTPLTVTYGAANSIGTHSGLQEGMVISLLDCLYALLLPSGNDAAVVIAENVAGMESRFVELMNTKAAELGMASTHYVDASGLSVEDHYTTVRDYLLLARHCMSNETFRQIVATDYYEVNINGVVLGLETTDKLKDYMTTAQAVGIKTGYTDEAGYCFVGAGNLGGIELYTVVFNAPTGEQRFADTASMLEWGFRHFRTIEIINTTQQVAEVALVSWIDKTVAAYVPAVIRVEIFDLAGSIEQDITINDIEGEATKGQTCGEIIWSQGGDVLTTSKVIVSQTVLAPDFFEGIGIGWDRFWGGFSGAEDHAQTSILLKAELAVPAAQPLEE